MTYAQYVYKSKCLKNWRNVDMWPRGQYQKARGQDEVPCHVPQQASSGDSNAVTLRTCRSSNLERFMLKDNFALLHTRKSYMNAATRNELNVANFVEVQLLGQHLDNDIWGLSRHHAMGMNDNHPRLIDRHCSKNEKMDRKKNGQNWIGDQQIGDQRMGDPKS